MLLSPLLSCCSQHHPLPSEKEFVAGLHVADAMATSPYYLSAYHPPTAGSSASHLPHGAQLHSPVSLPTDVEADQTQDYGAYLEESSYGASPDGSPTHMSILKSSKRKRTASLSHTGEASADGKGKPSASSGPSAYERKKVTRACDSCKTYAYF